MQYRRSARGSAHRQAGFGHILLILLMLVVVAAIGGTLFLVMQKQKNHSSNSSSGSTLSNLKSKTACNGNQVLQQSPVKPEDITTIIPLGNLAPPGHVTPTTHMYYNYTHTGSGFNKYSVKTTLYVPADMTVYQIMKMDNADLPKPYTSYRLDFSLCDNVGGYFILVQQLNDQLAAADQPPYDRTQESDVGKATKSHNWFKNVKVQLKAGDILGYAGGSPGDPDGLDMAIIDARTPAATVANPARWQDSDLHYACSLDYYPKALSVQLYAKLGDFNYQPTGTKNCGTVYQDQAGTAQGIWFTKDSGSTGLWDVNSSLALVHSNFDMTKGAFSMGNKAKQAGFSSSRLLYTFTPAKSGSVNLDFNLVKNDGTVYCYQANNGSGSPDSKVTILIQLTGEKSLRLGSKQGVCGSGPWTFGQFVDYVR